MRTLVVTAMLAALGTLGCSGEDPFDTGSRRSAAPEAVGVSVDTVESAGAPKGGQSTQQPAPTPPPIREKAEVGVTGRGDYGQGFVATPLRALVRSRERVSFMEVDYALKLYQASNGSKPKSHEEFMEKIVKANQIKLPVLQDGDEYLYDPELGELFVMKQQAQ